MANWLDKYEQGGLVLKQKTKDNYGKKPNPNDVQASVGPDFVGLAYDTTGRNYSPAWGGQFQSGGFLQPISYKLPSRYRIPYAEPSTELATSIGGVDGEPAYLIPTFKGGKDLKDPVAEYRKTGEHLGGPFKTYQEAEKWEQEIRHPYVEKGKPIPTPLKRWGDMQSGGRLPIITNDPKDPRLKAYNDSLKLSQTFPRWGDWADLNNNLVRLNGKAPTVVNTKEGLRGVRKPVQPVVYKKPEREPIIVNDPKDPKLKAYQDSLNLYNKTKDIQNPKYYTDGDPSWYNWKGNRKDAERFMRRNNIDLDYEYYRTNKFPGKIQPIKTGDFGEGMVYPIYKKPTQPVEYKKLEEIKPTQTTPTGSKKYIVNGMEVSEEDFLGSGATTGGRKRIIYNTPNKGTQKVLRLDGTPETDPDKIRRALATANKDEMAMGGSLPGSVGFTYARVAGSAPSNGKYAKKTKASAQNGKEMKFYQEGLDFKPNSIAQEGAIVDPMGQWAHPGEVTIIPATDITMEGVDYPVLGISDTGDTQMMYPGEDYDFDGEYVTEYPMMQEGGWLSKYQEKAPSDATRVAAPIKPLTKKEQEENARINKQTQKNTEERNKQIIADRKSKRETKGDVNVPGSFNITEKLRLFPESVGGVGEIIDEYVNPGTVVGTLADSLGESIAARSPEGVAATLAMTAGAGALGFDPLGSAIKLSKTAGKYLTEKTALKNAYKLNPYAFKANGGWLNKYK
jgi:hypothetical protein